MRLGASRMKARISTTDISVARSRVYWVSFALLLSAGVVLLLLTKPVGPEPPAPVPDLIPTSLSGPPQATRAPLPVDQSSRPDAPPQHYPSRELVATSSVAFEVREKRTHAPIRDAAVYTGATDGREVAGTLLGFTSDSGRLETHLSNLAAATASYIARSQDTYALFKCTSTSKDSPTTYLAEIESHTALTVHILDRAGLPLSGVILITSRRPTSIGERGDIMGRLRSPLDHLPDLTDPVAAIYSAPSNSDGRIVLAGLPSGTYFWEVIAPGYIPWENTCEPAFSVPGIYAITLHELIGNVLVVKGDEVVTYSHNMPAKIHQESLRHAVSIQQALREEHHAVLAYVTSGGISTLSELSVDVFLRHAGERTLKLPLKPIDSAFEPYVLDVGRQASPSVASGKVRLVTVDAKHTPCPGVRWSLYSPSSRSRKPSRGTDEIEVRPGDYQIRLDSRSLRRVCEPKSVRVQAGVCEEVTMTIPSTVVRCSLTFTRDGRVFRNMDDHVATFSNSGGVVEHVSHPGAQSDDIWLPPGQYAVKAWVAGFDVRAISLEVMPRAAAPIPIVLDLVDIK